MLDRARRKGNLLHCWWACKLVRSLGKIVSLRFFKKIKIELQTILPLDMYPNKTIIQKDTCTPMFITMFTIAKTWKQPKCLATDDSVNKTWHINTMEH